MANKTRNGTAGKPVATGAGTGTAAKAKAKGAPVVVPKISATVDGGVAGENRKERKEEARRQREALQRKIERRKYWRIGGIATAAVVVLAVVLAFTVFKKSPSQHANTFDQSKLQGLISTTDTSQWTTNITDLASRAQAMGLPPLGQEQLIYHIHQELEIFIDGKKIAIPAMIGIDQAAGKLAVIHVHATDGVIHVESPVKRTYTLANFFGVWGVNFTPTSIGGYRNAGDKSLRVYLNGQPYAGNPEQIPLTNHEIIVVTFGTQAELPNPIPSSFDWAKSSAG